MEMAEIVMNPVRQRIFQYLLVHETGTVKEIRTALPDVPNLISRTLRRRAEPNEMSDSLCVF